MKSPISQYTTTPHRALLPRSLALVAALCVGSVATYAATARPAFAAALDGMPLMQHLHGPSHAALHEHVDQVLTRAGASDAQKRQIEAIVHEAMTAEHADMARYHASLGRMKTLLTAAQVDGAAVERVRSEQDALLLDTNRRVTETLLRVSAVLTPAQRVALGTEIDRLMAAPMRHHHGE